jgi:hypothetical protein
LPQELSDLSKYQFDTKGMKGDLSGLPSSLLPDLSIYLNEYKVGEEKGFLRSKPTASEL